MTEHPPTEHPPFDRTLYADALGAAVDGAFHGIAPGLTEGMQNLLVEFGTLLAEKAQRFNLTRLTAPEEMALLHFLDTHHLARCLESESASVLDIGTGPGVPGIPLAIMRPDLSLTLIDGTLKKIRFVKESIEALGLKNARAFQARAEEHLRRRRYDVGVLRAAVKLPRMMEILADSRAPLKRVIFMLGSDGEAQARAAESRRYRLDAATVYAIPGRKKKRVLAVFSRKG